MELEKLVMENNSEMEKYFSDYACKTADALL